MAKKTYWTKCGRQFEKNSTATVTGYTINFEDPQNEECTSCPFKVEVTKSWGENKKFLRWECRAGSQPPNHKTDWVGSTEDKNSIHIHSLDCNLLEEIRQFCEDHPDLSAAYNSDSMPDCRMTLAVYCSPNKKGIAAKKELIEKFFHTKAPKNNKYVDDKGRLIFVRAGLGGDTFMTMYQEAGKWNSTSAHRLKAKELPIRNTEEEAQANLDQYAEKKGWRVYEKGEDEGVTYPEQKYEETNSALEVSTSKAIHEFDYSTVDVETAEFLQEKASRITEIRIKSVVAIGKELSEVFDKLSKIEHGEKTKMFEKWVESIGISSRHARRYIDAYEYILKNFQHIEDAEKIQPSLLFEISKPSAPKQLQEAVLAGDITTHKQYKELEEKLRKAEERAIKAINQKYLAETRANDAEHELKKVKIEKEEAIKAAEKELNILRQQIEQLKRNSDPSKVRELGQKIAEYQQKIQDYQKQIGNLNLQLAEARKQLKEKPIEVPAVQIVEKVIEKIPEQTKYEVINRTYATLLAAKSISKSDIEICREADYGRKMAIIEFLENLQDAIPEYLKILNEVPEQHKCEDCKYCEYDGLKEEDEAAGYVGCIREGYRKLVQNDKGCDKFEPF